MATKRTIARQDSGAVYVFTRTGGVWTQQAYLKASNTDARDQFGVSVAISGDTIAVGAQFEDSNGTQSDNSAQDSRSRLCVHAYRGSLDAAGLSQGLIPKRATSSGWPLPSQAIP